MHTPNQMIVFEFNELSSPLINDFMDRDLLPNFGKLYANSTIFTTDAGEDPPNLEPWIQWPTIHSGLTFDQHKIFHLGDGHTIKQKCIGELLSDAGLRVGIFGSMNVNYREVLGYFIPDPWHKIGRTWPSSLQPFYQTVANQVQESSKTDSFTKLDMLRFAWFMTRHGLTLDTAKSIAKQLYDERMDPGIYWRRASLLDHVSYDLFRSLNKQHKVQFATFFCNSTAHFQHYFWRNMQPERFPFGPADGEHNSLRQAIEFGYRSMDRLIGRALMDYPDSTVVLCTGLSQRPWTSTTKCTYRPRRFELLLEFAGIPIDQVRINPVMAEQFRIEFESDDSCDKAQRALQELYLDSKPLMHVRRESNVDLFCGCAINSVQQNDALISRGKVQSSIKFNDLFYMIHTVRSGRHDRKGLLWVGSGHHEIVSEEISIVDIAPTILNYFSVDQPDYMRGQAVSTQPIKTMHAAVV